MMKLLVVNFFAIAIVILATICILYSSWRGSITRLRAFKDAELCFTGDSCSSYLVVCVLGVKVTRPNTKVAKTVAADLGGFVVVKPDGYLMVYPTVKN